MQRAYFLCLIALLAAGIPQVAWATGDSLRYLRPQDSVFLTQDPAGNLFLHHELAQKQTLYSLAKFYGMTLDELYACNPRLAQRYAPGDVAEVPIPLRAVLRIKPSAATLKQHARVYYRVKNGDTVYGVGKRMFDMPVDSLKVRNQLKSDNLHAGQILFIGWMATTGVPADWREFRGGPDYNFKMQFFRESAEKTIRLHKGPAVWTRDANQQSGFFALHRFAAVGSVIEVYNPMSRQVIYLKVVGRIPDSIYGDEVVAVLSPKVARMLRGIDQRFYVWVKYY